MILTEGIVLGHHISLATIKVDLEKNQVIVNLHILKTQKNVHSFLGNACNYRHFVKNFTKISFSLFSLPSKNEKFAWTNQFQFVFESLKENLSIAPVLR
jgi:hypothetical protein